jgi:hypothetical protein
MTVPVASAREAAAMGDIAAYGVEDCFGTVSRPCHLPRPPAQPFLAKSMILQGYVNQHFSLGNISRVTLG